MFPYYVIPGAASGFYQPEGREILPLGLVPSEPRVKIKLTRSQVFCYNSEKQWINASDKYIIPSPGIADYSAVIFTQS